jgi:hypothetical protein
MNPVSQAMLRARSEQLQATADRLVKVGDELLYGVRLETAKAFVWAVHRGVDPTPGVKKTIYGGIEIGPGAQAHIAALVQHLAACALQIQPWRPA